MFRLGWGRRPSCSSSKLYFVCPKELLYLDVSYGATALVDPRVRVLRLLMMLRLKRRVLMTRGGPPEALRRSRLASAQMTCGHI